MFLSCTHLNRNEERICIVVADCTRQDLRDDFSFYILVPLATNVPNVLLCLNVLHVLLLKTRTSPLFRRTCRVLIFGNRYNVYPCISIDRIRNCLRMFLHCTNVRKCVANTAPQYRKCLSSTFDCLLPAPTT